MGRFNQDIVNRHLPSNAKHMTVLLKRNLGSLDGVHNNDPVYFRDAGIQTSLLHSKIFLDSDGDHGA